jgi:hypothetical protein
MSATATQRPTSEDRIRAALWFAERGFGVFSVWSTDARGVCHCVKGPACDNAGKHPIGRQGFHENTQDPAKIRLLLSAASEPNYGLVCPEGVFALDVDGEGIEKLADLEQRYGALPPTLRTSTAHGQHVFLRWPTEMPRPIGQLWGYVTRWGSGQNAGYVIGPRSVHATGAVYEPAAGSAWEIAELPEAWARSIVDKAPSADPDTFVEITDGGYQLPDYGYTGSRYDAILRFMASRYMRGIPKEEIEAGVLYVLAPRFEHPLAEAEVRSRFERAWRGTVDRLGAPVDFSPQDIAAGAPVQTLPGWPEPPTEAAMHGVLGSIVRAVAPHTEADPVAILGSLLATVGACMGHWRTIYQGSAQATNLFVVLVGDSSSGRKGTAGSIARDVMTAAYPSWEKLVVAGLGSGEGLVAHLKRVEDTEHRALVLESEFGRLLTVMAREGSTLSPVVRDAWDGAPMGRFLAREQSLVTWHHVGIVAHVTPIELRAKLTNTDAANGFGNRFMWLAVRRTRLVPFPESPRAAAYPYLADLHAAIADAQTPGEMRWSEAARDRWELLYATWAARARHGLLGAMLARTEAQITRLALLYALLDRSPEVDLDHLLAAESLWSYGERSVAYVFGSSTGNRDADALRDALTDGPLEWEAAKKAVGARRTADLRDAVQLLEQLGLAAISLVPRPTGGRPRRVVSLLEKGGLTEQTMQKTAPAEPSKGA